MEKYICTYEIMISQLVSGEFAAVWINAGNSAQGIGQSHVEALSNLIKETEKNIVESRPRVLNSITPRTKPN